MKSLEIKTLPVTIKVLEVGGRKMTKSVFSQIAFDQSLLSERIACDHHANEFELLGWVNYLPEKYNAKEIKSIWDHGFVDYPQIIGDGLGDYQKVFDPEYTWKYYRPRNVDPIVSVLYVTKWNRDPKEYFLARCIAYKYSVVQKYPQLFIAT